MGPCFLIVLAAAVICPLIGPESISFKKVFDFSIPMSNNPDALIFFRVRLPRCLLAILVGAALAASGATFQAILKNPLATPYTLGLSGGSSLASLIALTVFGSLSVRFPFLQPMAAFMGALLVLRLVYLLGKRSGMIHNVSLILAGVTLNLFFGALILLVQFMADIGETLFIVHWLMGNIDHASYTPALILLPFQAAGLGVLLYHARDMNLISLDEMSARSLGLDVPRVMKRLYIAATLVAGTAIAFTGPIGFVGLIIPHALRLLFGADHRLTLPASIMAGGAFLVLCDTAARTILAPTELPVGVITALLGGPFFLWLLLRRRYAFSME
ncbi:MAG TPA: iron ABC transporter permease [Candidatus Sumerlaeota bacterium]|nr:iron ABC transporter permease [Candidatus Sumerlaeota bacterium]